MFTAAQRVTCDDAVIKLRQLAPDRLAHKRADQILLELLRELDPRTEEVRHAYKDLAARVFTSDPAIGWHG